MKRRIPEDERINIGSRIRETREALGLSQPELAAILGVERNAVSQYETGDRVPDHMVLRSWCKRHEITYDWIFDGNPGRLPHDLAVKLTTRADASNPSPPSSARRAKQKAAK